MEHSSRLLNYVNARMRVTIQDNRVMEGTFMAFDKHMNLVLGDTEEMRKLKVKKAGGGVEEREEKRMLGLILLRGANVVSLQIVKAPSLRRAAGAAGPGVARAAPRGAVVAAAAAAPAGLGGAVRGVGGPPPGMMGLPPTGYPGPPGYPLASGPPPFAGMMPPPAR